MQMNIYLPEELGERVRAAEGLNVSQVCQFALRQELQTMEARAAATTDLDRAAERLRKSHGNWEKEVRDRGRELGADWAKNYAEWDDLVVLERGMDGERLDRDLATRLDNAIAEYLNDTDDVLIAARTEGDQLLDAFREGARDTFREIQKLM
jgi:hypothetical protein